MPVKWPGHRARFRRNGIDLCAAVSGHGNRDAH